MATRGQPRKPIAPDAPQAPTAAQATEDRDAETLEQFEDQGADEIPAEQALSSVVEQMHGAGDEGKIMIWRIDERTKVESYLCTVSPTEYLQNGLDEVQGVYGAGTYRVRVYGAMRGLITHRRIVVGEPIRKRPDPAAPQAALDVGSILAANNAAMMEGFKQLAAALQPPPQQAMGIREIIELFSLLNANKPPPIDPIAQALQLVNLRDKLAPMPVNAETGEVDGGMLLMKGLDTFGPLVKDIMARTAQTAAQAPAAPAGAGRQAPATLALPAGRPAPAAPVQNPATVSPSEDPPVNLALTLIKAPILAAAASVSDPWPFAGMVLQFFDEAQINTYIHAPDWFEKLRAEMPEAANHRAWFDQLRADVLEQLAGEGEPLGELVTLTPDPKGNSVTPLKKAD